MPKTQKKEDFLEHHVQDFEEQIGLTNYKFKDLPDWAKKAWLKQKQNNNNRG